MPDMKQINSMLATATALGYSQALVDVIDEIEKVRKECEDKDNNAEILLNQIEQLLMQKDRKEAEFVLSHALYSRDASHYVYILLNRLSRLNGNAYEVGRKCLPLSDNLVT